MDLIAAKVVAASVAIVLVILQGLIMLQLYDKARIFRLQTEVLATWHRRQGDALSPVLPCGLSMRDEGERGLGGLAARRPCFVCIPHACLDRRKASHGTSFSPSDEVCHGNRVSPVRLCTGRHGNDRPLVSVYVAGARNPPELLSAAGHNYGDISQPPGPPLGRLALRREPASLAPAPLPTERARRAVARGLVAHAGLTGHGDRTRLARGRGVSGRPRRLGSRIRHRIYAAEY